MTIEPARKLAAAGTAGIGALAAVAAFLVVGGLPGLLYAAGIVVATLFGAGAIYAGRDRRDPALVAIHERATVAQPKRWGRKSRLIAVLQLELEATAGELEEHRHACANLAAQLSRESEAARKTEQRLEERIRELEVERDGLHELVTQERERFEQTLDELGGGIGRHESEIAEIERELEALIAR